VVAAMYFLAKTGEKACWTRSIEEAVSVHIDTFEWRSCNRPLKARHLKLVEDFANKAGIDYKISFQIKFQG
jgi:hypothetical protein